MNVCTVSTFSGWPVFSLAVPVKTWPNSSPQWRQLFTFESVINVASVVAPVVSVCVSYAYLIQHYIGWKHIVQNLYCSNLLKSMLIITNQIVTCILCSFCCSLSDLALSFITMTFTLCSFCSSVSSLILPNCPSVCTKWILPTMKGCAFLSFSQC